MGPHVRIPFIDFMSNGGERSETFNLLFIFHLVRHIFLHSVFIKFIQSCFQNIIFSNTINQIYTTVALVGIGGEVGDGLLDGVLHLVPLLLLRVRYPLAQLDSSSLQDQSILLAVAQVDVDPWRRLHGWDLPVFLAPLGVVVLGADELAGVAETLASVGQVERGGVAVECRVRVARFLLYLLQPGALELRTRVAPTQTTA